MYTKLCAVQKLHFVFAVALQPKWGIRRLC
jgi:hypothetical protein